MPKVAFLYKRSARDDEYVLERLERRLASEGIEIFVDRNMPVGTRWAQEIKEKIQQADFVIALLSERAVGSEMVEGELSVASECQAQSGKPGILPIRVRFDGDLPPTFAAILEPLQFVAWNGAQDDERVCDEVVKAIQFPAAKAEVGLEPVGGAVPLDSKFYVVRPVDGEVEKAIERRDGLILIKGARQMGKTSLMARALNQARQSGAAVAFTDFQALNESHFTSVEAFFKALCALMARRLGLQVRVADFWDDYLDPNGNFEAFLEDYAIPKESHLIWGLDEVDRLFGRPFASEVFGLFRSWFNMRATEPHRPLARLTMVLAYATEPHLFISDLNQSPFNVGTRLRVDDFTAEEVKDLNRLHGTPLATNADLMRLYDLVKGQPFLVRRALNEMVQRDLRIDDVEKEAYDDDGIFGDHLRRMVMAMSSDHSLEDAVRNLLRKRPVADETAFLRLRRAGIVVGESQRDVEFRCRLYETYLHRQLV